MKNPVKADFGKHPTAGTSNALPDLDIGKKVNIVGNTSFALFPGQMAKVIQGHRLHSNQYLLARVYDADALNSNIAGRHGAFGQGDAEENESSSKPDTESKEAAVSSYVAGQILVIKGQDCPFYIPPTGIEVIPVGGYGDTYVRDAVTLEKLEYCILKNEKGHKRGIFMVMQLFFRSRMKHSFVIKMQKTVLLLISSMHMSLQISAAFM